MNTQVETRPTSTIPLTAVESTRIRALGHDASRNVLAVQFQPSRPDDVARIYEYENFTAKDYDELLAAESIGAHFERHIRPHADKYPYARMADPNTDNQEEA